MGNIMLALPAEAAGVITSADFQSVITALQNQFSVQTVVEVLAIVVGASVGFVFMWWGVRKALAKIMQAVRNGRAGV